VDRALDGPPARHGIVSASRLPDEKPTPHVIEPETDTSPGADAIPERASCAIKVPVFEGPLDLLLHLIRINEVDIHDIPIATISQQYLEYLEIMRLLDVNVAADYLLMAATLAYIKSRMLLPSSGEEDEEDGLDPRAELARRLAEYAVFRDAAVGLDSRHLLNRDVFSGSVDRQQKSEPAEVLSVSLFALLEALRRVLSSLPPELHPHQVSLERVSLQDRMLYVMDRLRTGAEATCLFEDLLTGATELTRHVVVMTFLAILELCRIQVLRIFQNQTPEGRPFGPVRVRLAVAGPLAGEVEREEGANG
jgi:segregation and condensation protein A